MFFVYGFICLKCESYQSLQFFRLTGIAYKVENESSKGMCASTDA